MTFINSSFTRHWSHPFFLHNPVFNKMCNFT